MATTKMTKKEFEKQVDELFDYVQGQIKDGKKWQNDNYRKLIQQVKRLANEIEKYAKEHDIKLDSKKLLNYMSKYTMFQWGARTMDPVIKEAKLDIQLSDIVKSIDDETLKKRLNNLPHELYKLIDPVRIQGSTLSNAMHGNTAVQLNNYLKARPAFFQYFDKLKSSRTKYYVESELAIQIANSYQVAFDSNKSQQELKDLKQDILDSFKE